MEGRKERRRVDARGLTKGLSSLAGGDGWPCFGRLPFGRVNSDPGQERKRKSSERKVKEQTGRLKRSQGGQKDQNTAVREPGGTDPTRDDDFT